MATIKRQAKITRQKKTLSKAEIAQNFVQFSKKLTVYVMAYWGLYRLAQLVVVVLRPEIADALVKFSSGVDTVAIAFGSGYMVNSISEKAMNMHKDVQKYMYANSGSDNDATDDGESQG